MGTRQQLDAAAEQSLLARCRRKDYEAFGRLVDAYQARVHGFVRRMLRNDEDALDVTQEVFVRAFQSMENFDGRATLRTWLFRIAHNLCIDRARKQGRATAEQSYDHVAEGDEPIEFPDNRWQPAEVLSQRELATIVEGAIEGMSEKLKTVLLLHDKEDMGYEEIAKAIEVPVGTVKSRLFLARNHLQKHVAAYLNGRA